MPLHYYLLLALAIAAEVVATTALAASNQLTRPLPTAVVVIGYAATFYLLALVLRVMPVGVVYAIWSGLGVVGVALLGTLVLGQRLDAPALIGMALIVAGVLVINLYSGSARH